MWKTGEAIALGFQHYILALGTAVMIPSFLVPLMGGTDVSPILVFLDFQMFFLTMKAVRVLVKISFFNDFLVFFGG